MQPITTSRQQILDRIASYVVPGVEPAAMDASRWTTFDDPLQVFLTSLAFVGGDAHLIDHPGQVGEILQTIPAFAGARGVVSLYPQGVAGTVDASLVNDPHELASLDWTIATGAFAVAENGAIWVDGKTLPHRVLLFIPQYLAIVIRRDQIVSNMHQAYDRIGHPGRGFGIFVSGPSKTADIEQSLVIGAHGCRKLQVFVL